MIPTDRIEVGPLEVVYTDDQLSFTVDASCCKLRNEDGSVDFWTTDLGELPYHRHFRGTEEDPFATELEPFEWDYNGYPDEWPRGVWVQSFYRCDDGMLIGFIHREDLIHDSNTYPHSYFIGFGVSHDGGKHWKYLGDVCGNVCNFTGFYANMKGVPYFAAKDGYFYLIFNDFLENKFSFVTSARVPMDEAIECIRRGELPKVKKYSGNGIWDTDPMKGTGAPILPKELGDRYFNSHSDAAYCSALDKYVLVLQTLNPNQVGLFFSDDCVTWEGPLYIDAIPDEDVEKEYCAYSMIVGLGEEANADYSTIGHEFYVYFTHKSLTDYPVDTYCRRKITIK